MQNINAFKIEVNGKSLDYRLGQDLDLEKVRKFFERKYKVVKIWSEGRHVLGYLEKNNRELFLKLATSEGIGAVTKIEHDWNDAFNNVNPRAKSPFWVPINYDSGLFDNNLFYLITDKFEGKLLSNGPSDTKPLKVLPISLEDVIEFSELIQSLEIKNLNPYSQAIKINHQDWFVSKTKTWFESIPKNIQKEYKLHELLKIVKSGVWRLEAKPRHGDFTPWHLIKLDDRNLGLIDGEHAMGSSVEYYDIGYFIQRVFSVLRNPELAEYIVSLLVGRKYDLAKLKVILSARAIGGFLDESLSQNPDYLQADKFRNWVVSL